MPTRPAIVAVAASATLVPVAAVDSISAPRTTGSSQWARYFRLSFNGRLMNPPTMASSASTASGTHIVPGERRHAGDGEPADDERRRRDRHELPQRTHEAHVLLVVHAVDHRAGAEEQQRLEEGVRDHVEDGGDVRAAADGQEHVAELRDR